MAKAIGVLGQVDYITVGSRVFLDLTNLLILYGYANGTGYVCTTRKQNGSAGYPVTTGKTLTVNAWRVMNNGAAALGTPMMALAYSNNDCGLNAAGMTSPVYVGGVQNLGNMTPTNTPSSAGVPWQMEDASDFQVPATKFLNLVSSSASANYVAKVFGYEA